jgi:hypothetical protein
MAAEARQPGGTWIYDGNPPAEGPEGGFEIERYHVDSIVKDEAVVVLAPSRPPFGEWEQLDEWPEESAG